MAFAEVDAFIDKIVLENKFDYLCRNHYEEFVYEEPIIDVPKRRFVDLAPRVENKENENFQNTREKIGKLQEKT